MIGSWSGTRTVEEVVTPSGSRSINVCNETWVVATQIDGQFTGTFQRSGGCTESGSMNGTVSMSGEVTGLMFVPQGGSRTTTCQLVSGGVYTGLLNGASLTAQTAERTVCVGGGTLLQFDRTFTLSMNKQ
jgi:hypothetical protein